MAGSVAQIKAVVKPLTVSLTVSPGRLHRHELVVKKNPVQSNALTEVMRSNFINVNPESPSLVCVTKWKVGIKHQCLLDTWLCD